MKHTTVFLFDLGRVIFDFDHRIATRTIAALCHTDEQKLFDLFFDSELIHRYECGTISSEEFFYQIQLTSGITLSFEEFVPAWNEIFTPKYDMVSLVDDLAKQYPLYMVSNVSELHFHYLYKKFPGCFRPFKKLYLSFELGLRKPDPALYQLIIREVGQKPSDIIYADDREDLVLPAKALGIDAIVFTSVQQFKDELYKRQILDPAVATQH